MYRIGLVFNLGWFGRKEMQGEVDSAELNGHVGVARSEVNNTGYRGKKLSTVLVYSFVIFLDLHSTKQRLPLVDSWSRVLD